MTPKTKFFDCIEEYCLGQLSNELKQEFEQELDKNPALRNEFNLQNDLRNSILESDIISLREKIGKSALKKSETPIINDPFELLEDFSDFEEVHETLSDQELIGFFDSLPKVHVHQHQMSDHENIHHFYKSQNEAAELVEKNATEEDGLTGDFELQGLEEAIRETDILEFRQKLKQVAKSVQPQFSIEQIEHFLDGELREDIQAEFEEEMTGNRMLQDEVQLIRDINTAAQETDIMNLRKKLVSIVESETSWSVSEQSIEDYVEGLLHGKKLEEFRQELRHNKDLQAEVNLRRHINELLAENDIGALKREIAAARENTQTKTVRMLLPEKAMSKPRFWRNSVAIILVLLGIAGVLGNGMVSVEHIYESYYNVPTWSPERSVSSHFTYLQQANMAYVTGDFKQVCQVLDSVPAEEAQNPLVLFYKASSLQKLQKYQAAIPLYTQVIRNADNLFVEEAEWYKSLCYLQTGQIAEARQQLLAVLNRKGYYADDAKTVLRRLRYSLK